QVNNTKVTPNTQAGYPVATGTTTAAPTVYLDFQRQLIHASVSTATIQISQFVFITGSIAFDMGATQTVAVTGGLATSLTSGALTGILTTLGITLPTGVNIPALGAKTAELTFMTVGASDVHAFVGMGGPYWTAYTTGVGDVVQSGTVNIGAISYSSTSNSTLPDNTVVYL